jgi:RHS repeat-associated protein
LPAPSGTTAPTESHEYDAVGNRIARIDFQGRRTTFQYDVHNRLLGRTFPDGTGHAFTYSATGQRLTATDARGVTRYSYDTRDRLTAVEYPDGRRLTYGYDAVGNRTTLGAVLGPVTLTTTTTHDALNRLDTVTDPGGRTYRHGYDANGNRASLEHPNGVTTAYRYDALNRLTFLESTADGGAVVQSYAYTLGPAGNRTRIDEHDGTVRSYAYDALYRVTGETVTQAAVSVYQNLFAYDPVGNRVQQDRQAGTDPVETVAYAYDLRDRLLTEGDATHSWDSNGNLTASSGPAGETGATYTWDYQDRLMQATTADGTATKYAYDADGNRVRTEITPATGPPEVIHHLVDPSGALSHVVAETDADGNLIAYYTRGDDLLAVQRPDAVRFYHADGLGSIRALTNETAQVTDRYTFEAFGTLLDHTGDDPNAYLFAGEPLDLNTGFYYLRARWMAPGVGRFVGMDLVAGLPEFTSTLHKYLYAGSNPVNLTDPSGLFTLPEFSITTLVNSVIRGMVSFVVDKAISLAIGAVTGQEVALFETADLLSLIPLGGLLGTLVKKGKKVVGPLFKRGKDLELVKSFVRTFARTGGRFERRLSDGRKVTLRAGNKFKGFRHIVTRHTVDYFGGILKHQNTMWPRGTTGARVVRYLDEAIRELGSGLKVGPNPVQLSNGIRAKLVIDDDLSVKTFFPLSGPEVFELKDFI